MPVNTNPTLVQQHMDAVVVSVKQLLAWILPSCFAVATKLAYESREKKISRARVFTSTVIAIFVGYCFDKLCTHWKWDDLRGFIVAISALTSETIVQYILGNTNKGLNALIRKFTGIDMAKEPEIPVTPKKEDNDGNS